MGMNNTQTATTTTKLRNLGIQVTTDLLHRLEQYRALESHRLGRGVSKREIVETAFQLLLGSGK